MLRVWNRFPRAPLPGLLPGAAQRQPQLRLQFSTSQRLRSNTPIKRTGPPPASPASSTAAVAQKKQLPKERFFDGWPLLRDVPRNHRLFWLIVAASTAGVAGLSLYGATRRRLHPSVDEALEIVEDAAWFQGMLRRHNARVLDGEASNAWMDGTRLSSRLWVGGSVNSKRQTADLSIWVDTPLGPARIRAWSSRPLVEGSAEWIKTAATQPSASSGFRADLGSLLGNGKGDAESAAAQLAQQQAEEEAARKAAEEAVAAQALKEQEAAAAAAAAAAQAELAATAASASPASGGGWWGWLGFGGGGSGSSGSNADAATVEAAAAAAAPEPVEASPAAVPAAVAAAPAAAEAEAEAESQLELHRVIHLQPEGPGGASELQKTIHTAPWQVQDLTVDFPDQQARWVWDRESGRWDQGRFDADSIGWLERRDLAPGPKTLVAVAAVGAFFGVRRYNQRLRPTLFDAVRRHLSKTQLAEIRSRIGRFQVSFQPAPPGASSLPLGRAANLRAELVGQHGKGVVQVDAIKTQLVKPDGTPVKLLFSSDAAHTWKVVNARFIPEKGQPLPIKLKL